MDGFVGACFSNETVTSVLYSHFLLVFHFIGLFGIFHFTNIYNRIVAVDDKVDLSAVFVGSFREIP